MWAAVGACYQANVAEENAEKALEVSKLAAEMSRFESRRFHAACFALRSTMED